MKSLALPPFLRRAIMIIALVALRFSPAFADEDSAAVKQVFIHQSGKYNIYVLRMKEGGVYDYCMYTAKKIYHDFGTFMIRHGKISFASQNRKRGFNSVGGKTLFITKKGIFKTRMKALLGKDAQLNVSNDPTYFNNGWVYNPLTGENMDPTALAKKKTDDALAKANASKSAKIAYTKNYFLLLAQNYASPYKAVLDKNYCGPECYQSSAHGVPTWNYDTSRTVLQHLFGTVVHETVHKLNDNIDGNGGNGYLVQPGIAIPVTATNVFRSGEIKKFAPADASQKILRYNIYVSDSSSVSANTSGIYGLMDEFSAYANDVHASVLAAQNAMIKGDTALAENFVAQAAGSYSAYYEFNLFMAYYLHVAKTDHPDVYKQLLANTNLRVAYTMLDANFKTDIDNLKRAAAIIEKKTGKDDIGLNEKMFVTYPKQLLVKEKKYLDDFAVKGVTAGNYFTFLK